MTAPILRSAVYLQTLSEGSVAYECSGAEPSGGGVSPRFTRRPKGQSTVEYVLIIAIIGLVIVFAGPGAAGAIRNQFNLVGNTVNSGTTGGVEGSGASGGGSAGADSATVQAAVAKDAKDWTLGEQKAVAEDISAKGEASLAYAKAKAAMDAGTGWIVRLTNGETHRYSIIGINHDDAADENGKAGLTFKFDWYAFGYTRMNATKTNIGGWEKSELRERLNSGDLWALLPTEFAGKIKPVTKMTDNQGGGKVGAPTATTDKVFPLSSTEIYGNDGSDGTQYEYYAENGVPNMTTWTRSVYIGKNDSDRWPGFKYCAGDHLSAYTAEYDGVPLYASFCF